MIESGSLTPGVDPTAFGLPFATAVRMEMPDARLRPFVSHYHALDSDPDVQHGGNEWVLPAWPAIRVIPHGTAVEFVMGDQVYRPLPAAAIYGTTTRAARMTATGGGLTVGIGITARGWARFFDCPAASVRDRVLPLERVWHDSDVAALIAALRDADTTGTDLKPILDRFLLARVGPPHPDDDDIAALLGLIGDERVTDLTTAALAIGIGQARLRRLSNRHFGFAPKTLLVRARFMRSFLRMLAADDASDHSVIAESYVDVPHYLRDARRFLGMTPRQFLAMRTPYMRAVLRARVIVGAADRAASAATQPARVDAREHA